MSLKRTALAIVIAATAYLTGALAIAPAPSVTTVAAVNHLATLNDTNWG